MESRAAEPLELCLFGNLEIRRAGASITLPKLRKVVSVLAYLALNGPAPRSTLAEAIWPDSGAEEARQSLRTVLAHIRRDLGPEVVEAGREIVSLGAVTSDLDLLNQASEQGDWKVVCSLIRRGLAPGLLEPWTLDAEVAFEDRFADAALRWDLADPSADSFEALRHASSYGNLEVSKRLVTRSVELELPEIALKAVSDYESATGVVWSQGRGMVQDLKLLRFPTTYGRADEIKSVELALQERAWVSLVGPGGIGKTHLALELLRREVNAQFLSVRTLKGGEELPSLLGGTWNDMPRCTLPALLILDEGEGVPELGEAIASLVRMRPDVRIILTSRIATGNSLETVIPLGPLSLEDAFRFLSEKTSLPESTVRQMCRKVGGHPMALQLLAGKGSPPTFAKGTNVLSPVQEAIEWTLSRLSPAGLRRLGRHILLGGSIEPISRSDADQELLGLGIASPELREEGSVLVVHSLIRDRLKLNEEQRKVILGEAWDHLEAYVVGRTTANGERVEDSSTDSKTKRLEGLAPHSRPIFQLVASLAPIDPVRFENLVALMENQWSLLLDEADHERLFRLLPTPKRASTWRVGARAATRNWNYALALDRVQVAQQVEPDDAPSHVELANILSHLGRHDEAEKAYREAQVSEGPELIVGSRIAWMDEQDDLALERGTRAIRWFREHGRSEGLGSALHECGSVAFYSGDFARALRLMTESVSVKRHSGQWATLAASLEGEAMVLTALDRLQEAKQLLVEALTRMSARGSHSEFSQALFRAAEFAFSTGAVDAARFLFDEFTARSEERGIQHHRRKQQRIKQLSEKLPGRSWPSFETDQALIEMVRGIQV